MNKLRNNLKSPFYKKLYKEDSFHKSLKKVHRKNCLNRYDRKSKYLSKKAN